MAKIETYRCDVCGAVKKQTNHWFRLESCETGALVQAFDGLFFMARVFSGQQMPPSPVRTEAFHLCGQNCVNRKLAEIMKQTSGPNTGQSGDRSEGCPVALQTSREEV